MHLAVCEKLVAILYQRRTAPGVPFAGHTVRTELIMEARFGAVMFEARIPGVIQPPPLLPQGTPMRC